jgi:large subunit ribosomal protein L21
MFAVIETGGKQYLVKSGDVLKVEKIDIQAGAEVIFDKVLLVADEKGENVKMGSPYLDGVTVTALAEAQGRHAKIRVVKYKRKVRYKRTIGHRQAFTKVKIGKV